MVVIHTNTALENQIECAASLRAGLEARGVPCVVTPDKTAPGDVHIVQGPWYCYQEWLGKPRVLWLNRCFYGDARDNVSLGWLNADGSRDFRNADKAEPKGEIPALQPVKEYRGTAIVFGDYGRDMGGEIDFARRTFPRVYFRPHPAERRSDSPVLVLRGDLRTLFDFADVAVGHSSTVLVDALIHGLQVHATDPLHVARDVQDREQWLTRLSWAQWSQAEMARGDFVEHLGIC